MLQTYRCLVFEGMGCFWGAERKLWREKGVYSTQVGYSGGYTPNPTYKEVCTGRCCSYSLPKGKLVVEYGFNYIRCFSFLCFRTVPTLDYGRSIKTESVVR